MTAEAAAPENGAYPTKIDVGLESIRSSANQTRKETLMAMISEELVNSLVGGDGLLDSDDDDDVLLAEFQEKLAKREAARKKLKRKKKELLKRKKLLQKQREQQKLAADSTHMHYAQVAGEHTSPDMEEYNVDLKHDDDDDSFAGGCLDDLIGPPSSSRNSLSSRGGSNKESSESVTTESCSSDSFSMGSGTMSVEEIRRFVIANIPKEVRDQIPQEAWGEIFQGGKSGGSKASKKSTGSSKKSKESAPIDAVAPQSEDEVSVISDVTGFVNIFPDGKRVESKLESVDRNDVLAPEPEHSIEGSTRSYTDRSSLMGCSNEGLPVATQSRSSVIVKKVDFGEVTLRYYERILTDNPSVQSGPAIGIGWRYKRAGRFDVDEFEQGRDVPRSSDDLVLSRPAREKMLKDAGFTQKEIAEMVRIILRSKNQRKQTVQNLSAAGMEEAVENARKRVARLMSLGKKTEIVH
ncbi:MAG: hypothetical protein SGILL_005807 [Bacillariaceae sp.]